MTVMFECKWQRMSMSNRLLFGGHKMIKHACMVCKTVDNIVFLSLPASSSNNLGPSTLVVGEQGDQIPAKVTLSGNSLFLNDF